MDKTRQQMNVTYNALGPSHNLSVYTVLHIATFHNYCRSYTAEMSVYVPSLQTSEL